MCSLQCTVKTYIMTQVDIWQRYFCSPSQNVKIKCQVVLKTNWHHSQTLLQAPRSPETERAWKPHTDTRRSPTFRSCFREVRSYITKDIEKGEQVNHFLLDKPTSINTGYYITWWHCLTSPNISRCWCGVYVGRGTAEMCDLSSVKWGFFSAVFLQKGIRVYTRKVRA